MEKITNFFHNFAPLENSEEWDNTGLLIDCNSSISKILLTIDLTPPVIEECIRKNIKAVICYHPVIFKPLKSIPHKSIIEQSISNGISVFCPHTALDERMNCDLHSRINGHHQSVGPNFHSIRQICEKLGRTMRIMLAYDRDYDYVHKTLCVGVGSVSRKFDYQDAIVLTGELSHHDLLYYRQNGCSVIMMDHSNSERGYLMVLKQEMERIFKDIEIIISENDIDPVQYYVKGIGFQ